MKILYISNSTIPSKTANSINVMKMCQAFSENNHEVTLLAPDKKNEYQKEVVNIYEYYGVKKKFSYKKTLVSRYKRRSFFLCFIYLFFSLF